MRIPDTREAAVGLREGKSRTGKGRAEACFLDGVWLAYCHLPRLYDSTVNILKGEKEVPLEKSTGLIFRVLMWFSSSHQ